MAKDIMITRDMDGQIMVIDTDCRFKGFRVFLTSDILKAGDDFSLISDDLLRADDRFKKHFAFITGEPDDV